MPVLELSCTPINQIVHVLEELVPCEHTWSGIWCNKTWASALGVGTNLLAHILTDSRELVLHCCFHVLLLFLARQCFDVFLNESLRTGAPGFELIMAPGRKIVHMLQELLPRHDSRSRIGSRKVWASTTHWVCSKLLTHILTETCQLVLHLGPHLQCCHLT